MVGIVTIKEVEPMKSSSNCKTFKIFTHYKRKWR
jgi:hypothetical protein